MLLRPGATAAAKLLLARLVYNDGLVVIFSFASIYVGSVYGLDFGEILVMGIALVVLSGATLLGAVAPDIRTFWVAAVLVGLMVGLNQSASRASGHGGTGATANPSVPKGLLLLGAVLALWGCGEGEVPAELDPPPDSLTLVFTRGEVPVPVRRPVPTGTVEPGSQAALSTALELLVQGPTEGEREDGYQSWFSEETSGVIRSVRVEGDGRAVVDFHDLRPLIPGAGSSAGSQALLAELNGTVFQFPGIVSVEYRMEGSCSGFWEWLQYGCQVVSRPEG